MDVEKKLQFVRRMLNKNLSPKSKQMVLKALHQDVSFTSFQSAIGRPGTKDLLNPDLVRKSIDFGYGGNLVLYLRLQEYTDRKQPIISPISGILGKSALDTARILVGQGVNRKIMKALLVRENFPVAAKQF